MPPANAAAPATMVRKIRDSNFFTEEFTRLADQFAPLLSGKFIIWQIKAPSPLNDRGDRNKSRPHSGSFFGKSYRS